MNGQMKKYKESLSRTPGPIMPSQIPKVKLDMRGMVKYAKERGIAPIVMEFLFTHLTGSLEMLSDS